MWIISQNKEKIVDVDGITLENNESQVSMDGIHFVTEEATEYYIRAINSSSFWIIATYPTKKRALEVVAEITKELTVYKTGNYIMPEV